MSTKCYINNKPIRAIIDTGSSVTLIRQNVAQKLGLHSNPTTALMTGIKGSIVAAVGQTSCRLSSDGVGVDITPLIMNYHDIPVDLLVGRDILEHPGVQIVADSEGVQITYKEHINVDHAYAAVELRNLETGPLSKDGLIDFKELMIQYWDRVSTSLKDIGCSNSHKLSIKLVNNEPIFTRPRRLSQIEREVVKVMIAELLEAQIIRPSNSPYASPMLLVKKKDGGNRLCVDYRELNKATVKDRFPLPRIDDQIDTLSKGVYYTTLDLKSGFYQIPVNEEDGSVAKTSFVTPDGQYEFLRTPFGLANAPSVFQRTLNSTLSGLEGVLVYIDDILIPAENEEQALQRLNQVLQRLREAGLTLNLEKCQFFQTSIEYLGKEIMAGTVRSSHHKIDCVTKALPPKTVRQLRQFLGLASYFRRFVPNFATKVSPLYNLLKKDVDFDWSSDCQQAFQIIKDILTQSPVLKIYNPVAETEVHTDASSVGLGAILLQKDEDGKLHPVAYYSWRTSPDESKYHSYDLETLAVVQALKHFRVYLL